MHLLRSVRTRYIAAFIPSCSPELLSKHFIKSIPVIHAGLPLTLRIPIFHLRAQPATRRGPRASVGVTDLALQKVGVLELHPVYEAPGNVIMVRRGIHCGRLHFVCHVCGAVIQLIPGQRAKALTRLVEAALTLARISLGLLHAKDKGPSSLALGARSNDPQVITPQLELQTRVENVHCALVGSMLAGKSSRGVVLRIPIRHKFKIDDRVKILCRQHVSQWPRGERLARGSAGFIVKGYAHRLLGRYRQEEAERHAENLHVIHYTNCIEVWGFYQTVRRRLNTNFMSSMSSTNPELLLSELNRSVVPWSFWHGSDRLSGPYIVC